jgi:hypothetical protein
VAFSLFSVRLPGFDCALICMNDFHRTYIRSKGCLQIPTIAPVFIPSLCTFALLAFASRPLHLFLSFYSVMAHIRTTAVPCEDVETEDVGETSIHEEVVESFSGFGQNTIDDRVGFGSRHKSNEDEDDEASDRGADAAVTC